MVKLHAKYYGRGPTRVRAYIIQSDVVVAVLEETFTLAEKTLIEGGEIAAIQDIRRRFQRAMEEEFRSIVEHATGYSVRSFTPDTDLHEDIAVEVFLLGAPLTNMTTFERER